MQEERQKRSLYIIKTEGKGWKTTEIKRKKYRSVMCVSAAGADCDPVYDEHENRRRGSLCGADLKA